MKKYSDLEKEYMGRYFKYYRKTNKIPIKDIFSRFTCSHDSYYDIESGIPKKDCDIYSDLLSNYQLKYSPNTKLLEKIDSLLDSFYDVCEEYNHEQIKKLIYQIKKNIEVLKDSILYKEIQESLDIIYKFYIEGKYLSLEEAYKTINLSNIFMNRFGSCLLEIVASSNWYYLYNHDLSGEIYKHLQTRDDRISKFWLAEEHQVRLNVIKTEMMLLELKQEYQNISNDNREVETLLNLFFLHRELNTTQAEIDLDELTQKLNEYKLNEKIKGKVNHSIGMYYYRNKKYNEAIPCFKTSYEIQKRSSSLLFMYACQSKLNLDIDVYKNVNKNDPVYSYLKFYELKQEKIDSLELEKYIMNDIMKLLKNEKYKEPKWSMFDYELLQLVKKNRSYKTYVKYHQMMEKFTKQLG